MDKTNKELGEILANETMSISQMEMRTNDTNYINKRNWLFLHLGFIAAFKLIGRSDKDCDEILEVAQEKLESIERDA